MRTSNNDDATRSLELRVRARARREASDFVAAKRRLHKLYAERPGTPVEGFEALMERDHWLGLAAAQELRLISKAVETARS